MASTWLSPDFTYLIKTRTRFGHLHHPRPRITSVSIPISCGSVSAPSTATRMTAGLVKLKLEEHRLLDKTKLITCRGR